jgi:hypothetical protein
LSSTRSQARGHGLLRLYPFLFIFGPIAVHERPLEIRPAIYTCFWQPESIRLAPRGLLLAAREARANGLTALKSAGTPGMLPGDWAHAADSQAAAMGIGIWSMPFTGSSSCQRYAEDVGEIPSRSGEDGRSAGSSHFKVVRCAAKVSIAGHWSGIVFHL